MDTNALSAKASAVIDGYSEFKIGPAVCSVPYFNNKTVRARGALDVHVGKGSPEVIADEVEALVFKHHLDAKTMTGMDLKKILVDNGIGIDCSGFAYHILDVENQERSMGLLRKHLVFIRAFGLVGSLMSRFRPVKNVDVATLADMKNSRIIPLNLVRAGDMITMMQTADSNDERNHILIITETVYQDAVPKVIKYAHAVAYPEDGVYGSGIKRGLIEIVDPNEPLLKQLWKESGSIDGARNIFARAEASRTELRRLKWL